MRFKNVNRLNTFLLLYLSKILLLFSLEGSQTAFSRLLNTISHCINKGSRHILTGNTSNMGDKIAIYEKFLIILRLIQGETGHS